MKSRIKSAIFFCLYYSGLEWLLARAIRVRAVAILMYHGVCDDAPMPKHINFHVNRDVFARQMRVLKNRYKFVPLKHVSDALANGYPVEKSVVITFDDGYRNNTTQAAPVLRELGLPATIFVATKFVESGQWMPLNQIYWAWSQRQLSSDEMARLREEIRSRPASDAREILKRIPNLSNGDSAIAQESFAMLTWDEIRELRNMGIDFGSHTHSHCNLAIEDELHQQQELLDSKLLLERNIGKPVSSFAYPYGRTEQMSERARGKIIEAGYQCAISAEYGLVTQSSDRYCMHRLGYDERIWVFAGEILYQFFKQSVKSRRFLGSQRESFQRSRSTDHMAKGSAS